MPTAIDKRGRDLLAIERRREIGEMVDRERSVRVSHLAERFCVTEETIRRDLEKLESSGKLVRSHGGAVSSREGSREVPFLERSAVRSAEKAQIAAEALRLIDDDDSILIDASSTALHVARLLPDRPLTVITNSMPVCSMLAGRSRIRTICTGGALSPASLSFVGPRAEQTLADYHVNRLFFSCTGVDFEAGLSDVNESQAMLKSAMLRAADHAYLLVDPSKFGVRALKRFATLSDVTSVITSDGVDKSVLTAMKDAMVAVRVARPI